MSSIFGRERVKAYRHPVNLGLLSRALCTERKKNGVGNTPPLSLMTMSKTEKVTNGRQREGYQEEDNDESIRDISMGLRQ